jgi:hypothetical protein
LGVIALLIPRVLTFARAIPWWAWLLAIALAWGGWQRHKAQSVAAEYQRAQASAAAEREAALQASITETARRLAAQQKVTNDARAQTIKARAAAAAAGDAVQQLRERLAQSASPAPGNPAPASRSETAALARVLGICAERYQGLAGIADAAIVAGKACEASYDALTKAP